MYFFGSVTPEAAFFSTTAVFTFSALKIICVPNTKTAKIQSKKTLLGDLMELKLQINDNEADQLMLIVDLLNDPNATVEDYASFLLSDLISKIWRDLTNIDIAN